MNTSTEKGFTLLYSLLVISVVLLLTSSIFSILLKEVRLASFGKASQIAYYASETGAECALYWSTIGGNGFDGSEDLVCSRGSNPATADGTVANVGSTFTVFVDDVGACAQVTVTTGATTVIESRGYNLCPTLGGADARRVERGLRVEF